jgi:AcrR family transcriptional regulator
MDEKHEDPRIQRTKDHVLDVAVAVLQRGEEAVTFSVLAKEAQVSRKTLYAHWGTVESVMLDLIDKNAFGGFDLSDERSFDERVVYAVDELSDFLTQGAAAPAMAIIMAAAPHDLQCREYLEFTRTRMWQLLCKYLAPMSIENYAMIVGPLFYMALSIRDVSPSARAVVAAHIRAAAGR